MRNSKHLRRAIALAALAVLVLGGIPAAQAATGGAEIDAPETSSPAGEELTFSTPMRIAGASWYGGPSMWGRKTACGETLRPETLGVAHRSLPCGTTVKFVYHGHVLVTQVIDRGPYVKGRAWDLTSAGAEALGLEGIGQVRYAVALTDARR
jgi:Lytic transglycolase